jgi:hypothetical protein
MHSDRASFDDAGDRETSDSIGAVMSVAKDFAALIDIFDEQLHAAPASDHETLLQIRNAKAAAVRGAKLCHELLGRVQSRN